MTRNQLGFVALGLLALLAIRKAAASAANAEIPAEFIPPGEPIATEWQSTGNGQTMFFP